MRLWENRPALLLAAVAALSVWPSCHGGRRDEPRPVSLSMRPAETDLRFPGHRIVLRIEGELARTALHRPSRGRAEPDCRDDEKEGHGDQEPTQAGRDPDDVEATPTMSRIPTARTAVSSNGMSDSALFQGMGR